MKFVYLLFKDNKLIGVFSGLNPACKEMERLSEKSEQVIGFDIEMHEVQE